MKTMPSITTLNEMAEFFYKKGVFQKIYNERKGGEQFEHQSKRVEETIGS